MKLYATKEKEVGFYNGKTIDSTKAIYRMIIGRRGNGKTYYCLKKVLNFWAKKRIPSAYIRRWKEEITTANIQGLFNPHIESLKNLTNGEYNHIQLRSGVFYACHMDEKGDIDKRDEVPIMYVGCLSTWEKSKGQDRGKIKYFIFDEFLTRNNYLAGEFSKFANCHASFVRNRPGVITYMLANTVNTESIYWEEMGINKIEKQKPGQIYLYDYNNSKLTVAVEYCAAPEQDSVENIEYYYAFDNPALEMIKTGEWQTDMYPHLDDFSVSKETLQFKFFLNFNESLIVGEIHKEDYQLFIFFHDFGNSKYKITDTDLVYTNRPTTKAFWLHSIKDTTVSEKMNNVINLIRLCFTSEKLFYSTNRVGEVVRNFMMNPFTSRGVK